MSHAPALLTLQQRLILDHLRHCRGGPLPVARLIVAIYGYRYDGAPDYAEATVRNQIFKMRAKLAGHGIKLLTIGHGRGTQGYMIDPDDLDRVEGLLQRTTQIDIELARARA